jgi:hypothetical protein
LVNGASNIYPAELFVSARMPVDVRVHQRHAPSAGHAASIAASSFARRHAMTVRHLEAHFLAVRQKERGPVVSHAFLIRGGATALPYPLTPLREVR